MSRENQIIAIAGVLVALLIAGAMAGYYYFKHEHAVILSQQQLQQTAELAKVLEVSQSTAKKLTAERTAANNREPDIRGTNGGTGSYAGQKGHRRREVTSQSHPGG